MIVCCCDGSVDGIFTAIYRAWEIGTSRTSISVTEGEDMELFSEYRFFEPDSSLAAKVASTIRSRLSPEIFSQVYHAAISGANDRGNVIYHFLIDAFKVGSGIVNHLVNPYVMRLFELDRNVRRESHNYLGFLRFGQYRDSHGSFMLARFAPHNNILAPEFMFTFSNNGTGEASRNLHAWARNYQLKDGQGDRLSLLNNWENTYFKFDEQLLSELMKEAKHLGVDMFLLDDGWFGNKHPRNSDNAGLGDWEAMKSKLPGGIPALVKSAKEAGVKFGIWIEPEMVNPKSELFEKHPDWAITLPNRKTYYYRNQLVLDLSNPKVQDFVFGVVDNILTENPEVAYFKWDCNSPITNVYSPYLKNKQGQLYIDHVRGIYNVLKRVKEKYPNTPMMLCSGGGARCDYEALKYFTEFWCSDNTDPIERLFIQWGFSQIFPSKAMSAHVTSWNKKTSVKFRTDVASMCKLGFDLGLKELNADELTYCQNAVANWTRLKKVILDGDQYRLVSPYDGNHMSVMYTAPDKNKAVLYTYDIHPRYAEKLLPVKLQGLDPSKRYKVKEINLMPNKKSNLGANEKTYSGDYLMKIGINAFTTNQAFSRVIELTAE